MLKRFSSVSQCSCFVRNSLVRSLLNGPNRNNTQLFRRNLSSSRPVYNIIKHDSIEKEPLTQIEEVEEEDESIPWYLRDDESHKLDSPIFKATFPEIPEGSPNSITTIINKMINDLGLDNFKVFDIRNHQSLPISTLSDFMIICEGKSERHIQNASQELITFIKNEFNQHPYVEGLLKPNSMIRMKRRMKRRMINKRNNTDTEFGIGPNTWIMIDPKVDDVFIHVLTPNRREQLNLELLWCKPEDRDLYKNKPVDVLDHQPSSDSIFAGIFKRTFHTQRVVSKRSFSTSLFRLNNLDTVLKAYDSKDFERFNSLSNKLKSNHQDSLKFLTYINSDLNKTLIDDVQFNTFLNILEDTFPENATLQHWEIKIEILTTLHLLSEHITPIETITEALIDQHLSRIPITQDQLFKFIKLLTKTPTFNSTSSPFSEEELTKNVKGKHLQLNRILHIKAIEDSNILNDEINLEILKLSTQQHLYNDFEIVPISRLFKVVLEAIEPNDKIIQFTLLSLLKANKVVEFYEYWNSLHSYEILESQIEVNVDSRPWDYLFELIEREYRDNFVEVFIHEELPNFIDFGNKLTDKGRLNILEILNRFDDSGVAYSQIREFLK